MDKKFFELNLGEIKAVIGGASAHIVATSTTYVARPPMATSSVQVTSSANNPNIAAFIAKYQR